MLTLTEMIGKDLSAGNMYGEYRRAALELPDIDFSKGRIYETDGGTDVS